jgi:hypothetical protein
MREGPDYRRVRTDGDVVEVVLGPESREVEANVTPRAVQIPVDVAIVVVVRGAAAGRSDRAARACSLSGHVSSNNDTVVKRVVESRRAREAAGGRWRTLLTLVGDRGGALTDPWRKFSCGHHARSAGTRSYLTRHRPTDFLRTPRTRARSSRRRWCQRRSSTSHPTGSSR